MNIYLVERTAYDGWSFTGTSDTIRMKCFASAEEAREYVSKPPENDGDGSGWYQYSYSYNIIPMECGVDLSE